MKSWKSQPEYEKKISLYMRSLIQHMIGQSFSKGVFSWWRCTYSCTMSLICCFVGLKPTRHNVLIHKSSCFSSSLLKIVNHPDCLFSISPNKLSSYKERLPLTFHIFLHFLLLFSWTELQLLFVGGVHVSSFFWTLLNATVW